MESTHERPDKYVDISLIRELFDQMERNNLELANDSLFRIMTKNPFRTTETEAAIIFRVH